MKLRDYQLRAVEGTFAAWQDTPGALVVLPTGCGKTIVIASVAKQLLDEGKGRVMVLAHREELVRQAQEKIAAVTGREVAIEMAEERALPFLGIVPEIVVSTVQTQNSNGRMERFDPKEFAALIIDEAHHATSESYRRVTDWYLKGNPNCRLLGVTATPDRKDGSALGQIFGKVACEYGVLDAINDGWLVPIRQQFVAVESLDFSHISTSGGDLNQKELDELMEQEENLQRIAAPTRQIIGARRAIMFAASVKQAERLSEILNRGGIRADWVSGETPKDIRRDKLTRFRSGEIQIMVNVGVLTEGFDDAGVEVVVMARPTKSRALYAQMAGRATRPAAEIAAKLGEINSDSSEATLTLRREMIAKSSKPSCLILDFVGNSGRHKLITSADILGGVYDEEVVARAKKKMCANNPVENPDGEDVSEALEAAKREIEEEKRQLVAKRKDVIATAKYVTRTIDPFDCYDLVEVAEADPGFVITATEDGQLQKLLKKDYAKCSLGRRQALVVEMRRRKREGVATLRQAKFLAKRGIVVPMRSNEARRTIERISVSEGWKRVR